LPVLVGVWSLLCGRLWPPDQGLREAFWGCCRELLTLVGDGLA
jgi:hypothetical protein